MLDLARELFEIDHSSANNYPSGPYFDPLPGKTRKAHQTVRHKNIADFIK